MDLKTLKEKVVLSEYIGQYCELVEKEGELWCLSPFTCEKTPSFSIRDEEGVYYDFSSGHGGNIYTFVQRYHKVSFSKAVEIVKEYAGVTEDVSDRKSSEVLKIMKRFAPPKKKEKIPEYSVLSPDYMLRYDFDLDQMKLWTDEGITVDSLKHFGVMYDKANRRIVYPLFAGDGNMVGVSGRTTDPQWKEKGIRKYTYCQKMGTVDFIYGLYENRAYIEAAGEIILFEGCKSVMKAHSYGYKNAGALLTSHLDDGQLKALIQLGCKVTFALDKGIDVRMDKNIKRLRQFVSVSYIEDSAGLLDEKDAPVDKGKSVFEKLYAERRRWK